MAKFLLTWELGGGLGHMTRLKPIVRELRRRGHRVALALRILNSAHAVFGDLDVEFWQAPFTHPSVSLEGITPATFGQLLAESDVGFGNYDHLSTSGAAWRSLFEAERPDVVLFEHSPTALLASRGFDFRRVLVGSGFSCPPTEPGLPRLRAPADDEETGARTEARALQNACRLLEALRLPPIDGLADLYRQVDDTLLCTFAELDHFGSRPAARYWGSWSDEFGKPFEWPAGEGKKIFGYLKPCPALPALLQALAASRMPTVVHVDNLDAATEAKTSTATMRLRREPLNMRQAAAECDLAILNAGHGALAAMLLAGKPTFLMPIYQEQWLLAARACQQGSAAFVGFRNVAAVEPTLQAMLASNQYGEAARGFAAKYADYDPVHAVDELTSRVETLLAPQA